MGPTFTSLDTHHMFLLSSVELNLLNRLLASSQHTLTKLEVSLSYHSSIIIPMFMCLTIYWTFLSPTGWWRTSNPNKYDHITWEHCKLLKWWGKYLYKVACWFTRNHQSTILLKCLIFSYIFLSYNDVWFALSVVYFRSLIFMFVTCEWHLYIIIIILISTNLLLYFFYLHFKV